MSGGRRASIWRGTSGHMGAHEPEYGRTRAKKGRLVRAAFFRCGFARRRMHPATSTAVFRPFPPHVLRHVRFFPPGCAFAGRLAYTYYYNRKKKSPMPTCPDSRPDTASNAGEGEATARITIFNLTYNREPKQIIKFAM